MDSPTRRPAAQSPLAELAAQSPLAELAAPTPPPVQRLPSHDKKLLAQAYASPLPGRVGPPR